MKSLKDLEEIRKRTMQNMSMRANNEGYRIIVGMATCGIAAGARPVMNAFALEIREQNITNANVTMTGCIGMCRLEPIVEVIDKDGNKTTYVEMDADKAKKVIHDHILGGKVVTEYTVGKTNK